jgi:hypothetical protein
VGCAVDSCQGIFRLSSWVHPRNRRPRLFFTKVRVHLLPQPTIDNILLDPPFCGVVHHPHTRHYRRVQLDMAAPPERLQVRSLSLRHLAAIASGEPLALPARLLLADAAVSSKCTLQSKTPRLQQALILRVCHILRYPTDPRGRAGVRVLLELFPLVVCDDRRVNLPNRGREASFVARG